MRDKKVLFLTQAAVIAALYCVLTMFVNAFNLANGAIQVRISEALCVLPFFTPAAVPGVIIGCFLSNILTGCALPDIIFGTLATALGAVATYKLRDHRFLCTLPPVISNMIIIPLVLEYAYHLEGGIPFFAVTVGAGEVISCVVLGSLLISALIPVKKYIFQPTENVA